MKVIFHLDLDSYFVSAARSVNPSLNGKNVVVGTIGRRAIISAASYEVKKLGVYVPMPIYKAEKLVPDLVVVDPDYNLYTKLSTSMFNLIQDAYTPMIEIGSIDECFIDVTDIWQDYGSPVALAKHIQKTIKDELKLPVSIGIGDNKFVAKMASPINKPFGISVIKPGDFLKIFKDEPLIRFFGIGYSTEAKLNEVGINTIGELAKANPKELKQELGIKADDLVDKANGNGSDELDIEHNDLKSISNSITFMDYDRYERKDILDILYMLTRKVSYRMSSRNMIGKVISIGIKEKGGKQIRVQSKQTTLKRGIGTHEEIFKVATQLFDQLWQEQVVKLVSVGVTQLEDIFETTYQTGLFDKDVSKSDIEVIVDDINKQFRKKVVVTGRELTENIKKKQKQSKYLESDRLIK